MTTERNDVRTRLLDVFDDIRQRRNGTYEPERFMSFLTEPPQPRGRRLSDSFAGRWLLLRFVEAVQIEFCVCFRPGDWEQEPELEQFVEAISQKLLDPAKERRIAQAAVAAAHDSLRREPIRIAVYAGVVAVVLGLLTGPIGWAIAAGSWLVVVGTVTWLNLRTYRYSLRLLERVQER